MNAPKTDYPPEAIELLRKMDGRKVFITRGLRIRKSPIRDKLKRRGLIYSKPPNANIIMPAVAGHGSFWNLTDAGRELLDYLDS